MDFQPSMSYNCRSIILMSKRVVCYHAQKCEGIKKSSNNFSENQGFQQCLSLSRTLSHLQQSRQQLLCLHFQIHFPFPFPAAVTATATVGRQTGHFCFCFRITCLLQISHCSQIPFYHSVMLFSFVPFKSPQVA